jgi:poly(3-hydroxybutyrate) depolymerase
MSARLISSRTSLLRAGRTRRQNARLLELLYLACALLLGALLAATTLAAAPLRRDDVLQWNEHGRQHRIMSPVVRIAPRVAAAEFDSK